MSRAKAKRAAAKPTAPIATQVAVARLERAIALLSCLAFAADEGAELDLGPVAIAARGLIDDALATLAPAGRGTP